MREHPLTIEYFEAVLLRSVIRELRLARICRNRTCRRARRCGDCADRQPPCLQALHSIDLDRLWQMRDQALAVLQGRVAPVASSDPEIWDREDAAIMLLFDCVTEVPEWHPWVYDWTKKWLASTQPQPAQMPPPPAPVIDAGALAREMRAELKRMGIDP